MGFLWEGKMKIAVVGGLMTTIKDPYPLSEQEKEDHKRGLKSRKKRQREQVLRQKRLDRLKRRK